MLIEAIPLVVAGLFAGLLGFAAHRGNICMVRAAAEIVSARTAFMLASIGKSALWVVVLTLPFLWLMPTATASIGGWQLTVTALLGGLIFGFGAAINGACAYSTMTRLIDGEVRMSGTIGGFAVGILTFAVMADTGWIARPQKATPLIASLLPFALLLSAVLLAWALFELYRVWRHRPKPMRIVERVLAPQYRLSTAALLIGVAGTVIFLLIGSPGYTLTLQSLVQGFAGMGALPPPPRWILLLAVLAGILISTLHRGSFRLDWRPQLSWLRNIGGGALMGLGTSIAPGGNDALVLYGVPSFSPHALPALATMLLGAAIGLVAMKYIAGTDTRVVCRNDIYRTELQPRGSILNSHPPRGSA